MPKNGYLNTTIQKGGLGGHPSIWEHVATLWDVVKDAKTSQKNLVAICLDLANAYGSVPHAAIVQRMKKEGKRTEVANDKAMRGDQPPKSRGSGGAL